MFKTHRSFDLSTGVKNASIAVFNTGSTCVVIYHKTPVVERRGKVITLRNGGWDTVSTRAVINQALVGMGYDGQVLRKRGETLILLRDGSLKPFVSGMSIKAGK